MHINEKDRNYQPVIIIGAARSGTNMLRNCLATLEDIDTWPCDEINLIWRHGNRNFPSDELLPSHANPVAKRYIRLFFDKFAKDNKLKYLVEKTCANSLRIPFINEVIREAKYIYIIRDGRDASASTMKRWKASVEPTYLLKKIRFVPISDIPYYGVRFLRNRWHQLKDKEKKQAYWGPRIASLEKNIAQYSFAELCARQWVETVRASQKGFSEIGKENVCSIHYEDFIQNPQKEMTKIVEFLGYPFTPEVVERSVARVRSDSVGKWKKDLSLEDQQIIEKICKPVLEELGYEVD